MDEKGVTLISERYRTFACLHILHCTNKEGHRSKVLFSLDFTVQEGKYLYLSLFFATTCTTLILRIVTCVYFKCDIIFGQKFYLRICFSPAFGKCVTCKSQRAKNQVFFSSWAQGRKETALFAFSLLSIKRL